MANKSQSNKYRQSRHYSPSDAPFFTSAPTFVNEIFPR